MVGPACGVLAKNFSQQDLLQDEQGNVDLVLGGAPCHTVRKLAAGAGCFKERPPALNKRSAIDEICTDLEMRAASFKVF